MRTVPPPIAQVRKTHYRWFIFWMSLHYILGATATTSTALLAIAENEALPAWLPKTLLAVVAVVSSGLITFGRIREQAFAYLKGFRTLNLACIQYCCGRLDDEAMAMQKLLEALADAEQFIEASDAWTPQGSNKALEPMTTAVTTPVTQEPRHLQPWLIFGDLTENNYGTRKQPILQRYENVDEIDYTEGKISIIRKEPVPWSLRGKYWFLFGREMCIYAIAIVLEFGFIIRLVT